MSVRTQLNGDGNLMQNWEEWCKDVSLPSTGKIGVKMFLYLPLGLSLGCYLEKNRVGKQEKAKAANRLWEESVCEWLSGLAFYKCLISQSRFSLSMNMNLF